MGFWEWVGIVVLVCLLFDIDILELLGLLGFLFMGLVSLAFWVLVVTALINLATL